MPNNIKFSFIIPTISRTTLRRTLMSIEHGGADSEDQIVVIGDGYNPEAKRMTEQCCPFMRIPYVYDQLPRKQGSGSARMLGLQHATGSHLLFIDDDDQYQPNKLKYAAEIVQLHPTSPHVFRMRNCNHDRAHWHQLWDKPELTIGNIGTPMVVLPNIKEKIAIWDDRHFCSDFFFFQKTFRMFPEVIWNPTAIVDVY